jgi:orotate phosphoribosyltransferase
MTDTLDKLQTDVARALLAIDAIGFTPDDPITFKSGILSPVYVDNRKLPFWPDQWRTVIEAFRDSIALHGLATDVIAGIAAAGIPHSAALAYVLGQPSVFVRKEAKEHGTRSRIEGGEVTGKRVLLVEDLVTTGSSSLSGVEALREAGAEVTNCLCITTYGFADAQQAFDAAGVRLIPLTPFATILHEAHQQGRFGTAELATLQDWLNDPRGWASRRPPSEAANK